MAGQKSGLLGENYMCQLHHPSMFWKHNLRPHLVSIHFTGMQSPRFPDLMRRSASAFISPSLQPSRIDPAPRGTPSRPGRSTRILLRGSDLGGSGRPPSRPSYTIYIYMYISNHIYIYTYLHISSWPSYIPIPGWSKHLKPPFLMVNHQ